MKIYKEAKSLTDYFIEGFQVLTFNDLEEKSGFKSRTLQRKIKSCNLLVSYNQNSKFYTTSKIARFNHNGVWNYKQILFSKHGNLFETIIILIDNSINGYSGKELSGIIEVKADDALRILWHKGKISKQKVGGIIVYFPIQKDLFAQQLLARQQQTEVPSNTLILSDYQRTIAVLVEIILQDNLDTKILLKGIKKRKFEITIAEIQTVIEHYQLKKKKNKL